MNKYEAMMIFPESLKEEGLEAALEKVKVEIEKSGGKVEATTRLGRRPFARPMQKEYAGVYIVLTFLLGGDKVTPLLQRFKLNEDLFRIQIVRVPEVKEEAKEAKAAT